ncbi:PP2C family protein-serine/threonine phosphatase [Streptomyces sp. NPDC003077]|uniref:PP2C family protein-serine/threonine phosphatase n=1 Tax=Streptomyces sp. NPDC003077 TaxID=3154443 RepID=UPI0033A9A490
MPGVRRRGGYGWLLFSTALAGALVALDVALGPGVGLTGLLLICPLLSATRLDGARTAVVSVVTLAAGFGVAAYEHTWTRPDEIFRLAVLTAAAAYAAWVADHHAVHDNQLADVASTAQRAILRPTSFQVEDTFVCARYRSASPEAVIGGDLYAFADTPGGLRMLLGDVRGKGLEAVRLSAAAIGHFRDCAYTHASLAEVVRETDRRLAADLGDEDFITALVAEFTGNRVHLVNCGHHPPLHLPADGPAALLPTTEPTTPIGLCPVPRVQDVELAPGDRLLFYTDGLAEARNADGAMLDLVGLVPDCSLPRLDDALDTVLASLTRHTGGAREDDVALVLVQHGPSVPRCRGHGTAASRRG